MGAAQYFSFKVKVWGRAGAACLVWFWKLWCFCDVWGNPWGCFFHFFKFLIFRAWGGGQTWVQPNILVLKWKFGVGLGLHVWSDFGNCGVFVMFGEIPGFFFFHFFNFLIFRAWGGAQSGWRHPKFKFPKYGCIIYRWKEFLMLIIEFEFVIT